MLKSSGAMLLVLMKPFAKSKLLSNLHVGPQILENGLLIKVAKIFRYGFREAEIS